MYCIKLKDIVLLCQKVGQKLSVNSPTRATNKKTNKDDNLYLDHETAKKYLQFQKLTYSSIYYIQYETKIETHINTMYPGGSKAHP